MLLVKEFEVFACHRWQYTDDLVSLKNLIERRSTIQIKYNERPIYEAIDSENAETIKRVLRDSIIQSDIVLALASVYASRSEWMEWELKTAYDHQIPIVGIVPRGAERISSMVNKYSDTTVKWNGASIIEAIQKYSKLAHS